MTSVSPDELSQSAEWLQLHPLLKGKLEKWLENGDNRVKTESIAEKDVFDISIDEAHPTVHRSDVINGSSDQPKDTYDLPSEGSPINIPDLPIIVSDQPKDVTDLTIDGTNTIKHDTNMSISNPGMPKDSTNTTEMSKEVTELTNDCTDTSIAGTDLEMGVTEQPSFRKEVGTVKLSTLI